MIEEATKNMTGDQEKYVPVAKALINQLVNVADSFLRDAQAATVGISFGENGINSTVMAEFEPSSYIGTAAKGLKNSDASMLTGLPAGKYLVFGGGIIPDEDKPKLEALGVSGIFGPGTNTDDIVVFIHELMKAKTGNT